MPVNDQDFRDACEAFEAVRDDWAARIEAVKADAFAAVKESWQVVIEAIDRMD